MASARYRRDGHGQTVEEIRWRIADYESELKEVEGTIQFRVRRAALLRFEISELEDELHSRDRIPGPCAEDHALKTDMLGHLSYQTACAINNLVKLESRIQLHNLELDRLRGKISELQALRRLAITGRAGRASVEGD